jgi:hypothetical protein
MRKFVLFLGMFTVVSLGVASAAEAPAGHPMAGHAMAASNEPATCGQMISGMAAIPAKLSEGATSVAEMLDAHAALMGKDKNAKAEAKGLRAIAKSHKQVAASLMKISEEMKKAATWPAAPHDMAKMSSDPKLAEATKKVIEVHKEIIALFQKMVADMEAQQKKAK